MSEHVLAITGAAMLQRQPEVFADRFIVPQVIGTFEGDRMIEDRAALIETFWGVVRHMQSIGCTDLMRYTLAAEFETPDCVTATFESHALNGGVKLRDPVVSYGKLRRVDGIWKVAESRYAVSNEPQLDRALMGSRTAQTDEKRGAQAKRAPGKRDRDD